MTSKHTIEKRKILKPIKQSRWFYLGLLVLGIVCFIVIPDITMSLWIFFALGGIPIIIQILLHFNYYLHDKNVILTIDYGNRIMIYEKNSKKTEFSFADIKIMRRYQGSKHSVAFDYYVFPSNFYHYTVIVTNDNRVIRFSDFVKEEIDIYGINKKKVIVPFFNFMT
jgi:hypothetical protein